MATWLIFIGSRETAREYGDRLLGRVKAIDRANAIRAAEMGEWINSKGAHPPVGAGYWPVLSPESNR